MPATAAEGVWRGTKPSDEPWRPDHFAYKFGTHEITHVRRDNPGSGNASVHTLLCVRSARHVRNQVNLQMFVCLMAMCGVFLRMYTCTPTSAQKSCQSLPRLGWCADDTDLSLPKAWVIEWLKGILMRSSEEESNISPISLSSGGRLGHTMEIRLGTWEVGHDVTDMSWHYWTACRSRAITTGGYLSI